MSIKTDLKKYILEKLNPILNTKIRVPKTEFEMNNDDELNCISYFDSEIQLYPILLGGYTYEYIYKVDVNSSNSLFTETEDVDIKLCIPDLFSNEEMKITINKLNDRNSIFNVIVLQIITLLVNQDYSDSPYLDDLPENSSEFNFDSGKMRFIISDSFYKSLAFQKIEVICYRDSILYKICDIMIALECGYSVPKLSIVNGINCLHITELLNYELSALKRRYKYKICYDKTHNHIGRILFLLDYINNNLNDLIKTESVIECSRFILSLGNKYDDIRKCGNKLLLKYKNKNFRVIDLFVSIKEYGLSINNQIFHIFY